MNASYSQIEIGTQVGKRHVNAIVFGHWAAHERWNRPNEGWVITHVETGLNIALAGEINASEAIAGASALETFAPFDVETLKGERWLVEAILAEVLADEEGVL